MTQEVEQRFRKLRFARGERTVTETDGNVEERDTDIPAHDVPQDVRMYLDAVEKALERSDFLHTTSSESMSIRAGAGASGNWTRTNCRIRQCAPVVSGSISTTTPTVVLSK